MNNTFTVLTYNIHHGEGWKRDVPEFAGFADLEQIARIIRSVDPDIVALQEVDRRHQRSGLTDQPAFLGELLGMNACFGCNLTWPDGSEYGVATLSRFPILSHANGALPGGTGLEPRGVLQAVIDVPGVGDVTVLNTHLQHGGLGNEAAATDERRRQAMFIIDLSSGISGPLILMGDFNADPADDELEPLAHLYDAWIEAGVDDDSGMTIPGHPMQELEARIDIVFTNDRVQIVSARVVNLGEAPYGSDHLPVAAQIQFQVP